MATQSYEGLFIIESNKYARDPAAAEVMINEMITKQGGEILVSRVWEERRLAYPIAGQRKGTYWLTYFRLDPLKITPLNRDWQINDSILRALVIKIDPRVIDTLVAHALGQTSASPQTEPEAVGAGAATE